MCVSNQDIAISKKIVEALFERDFFNAISWQKNHDKYCGEYYNLGYYQWVDNHRDLLKEMHIKLSKGETKVVIISDELSDWVIKLGLLRETCPSYVRDNRAKDFCGLEAFNYKLACIRGVEDYFAKTYDIGKYNGINIYLQEKIETDTELFSDKFYEYASHCSCSHDYSGSDVDWEDLDEEERILAIYAEDESKENLDKLIKFVYERDINDLHDGNWGITKDNRYVVFDFSGYC